MCPNFDEKLKENFCTFSTHREVASEQIQKNVTSVSQ